MTLIEFLKGLSEEIVASFTLYLLLTAIFA